MTTRAAAEPATTPARSDAIEVTFQTLNRYLGVAVGEHLGYLFTGLWTALAGVALIQSDVLHPVFGIIGLVLAPLLRSARWSSSDPSSHGAGSWPAPSSRSPTSAGRCGCSRWASLCWPAPDGHRRCASAIGGVQATGRGPRCPVRP
jgi:hypothetical protein